MYNFMKDISVSGLTGHGAVLTMDNTIYKLPTVSITLSQ